MPRLERALGSGWIAWALASVALSLQHATLPLVFNGPYLLWRAVMYLPFALYIGLVIKLRPSLLPFLMIGHALIDIGTWAVYFTLVRSHRERILPRNFSIPSLRHGADGAGGYLYVEGV